MYKLYYKKAITFPVLVIFSFSFFSLNLGECEVFHVNKLYFLLAKLYFINECSDESRKSFRSFFEGYEPDITSTIEHNVSTCFDIQGSTIGEAKTPLGKIATTILNKKELFFIFQLISPLETFQSLILNDIDIGKILNVVVMSASVCLPFFLFLPFFYFQV